MQTRLGWTLRRPTSLKAVCVSCAALLTPALALAADSSGELGNSSFDRRVLTLLVIGCVVGMIAGWANAGPRDTRLRLLKKQKDAPLSVIVPAGPSPRLIPSDSPNATRARWTRAPIARRTPAPNTLSVRSTAATLDHS